MQRGALFPRRVGLKTEERQRAVVPHASRVCELKNGSMDSNAALECIVCLEDIGSKRPLLACGHARCSSSLPAPPRFPTRAHPRGKGALHRHRQLTPQTTLFFALDMDTLARADVEAFMRERNEPPKASSNASARKRVMPGIAVSSILRLVLVGITGGPRRHLQCRRSRETALHSPCSFLPTGTLLRFCRPP